MQFNFSPSPQTEQSSSVHFETCVRSASLQIIEIQKCWYLDEVHDGNLAFYDKCFNSNLAFSFSLSWSFCQFSF